MRASTIVTAALLSLASANPTNTVRQASNCEQNGSVRTGAYTVYNNLWGKGTATSGSQCFSVTGLSNGVLSWVTNWSWAGGAGQVKSYANAVVSLNAAPISTFHSLQSTWKWSYTGSSIVANVAYDLFTSSSPTGKEEVELMVWLTALGAKPISSTYDASGNPVPIATTTIVGITWKLYKGPNGQMTVFSFVASSQVNSFSGNLLDFYTYLISSQGFSGAQYLKSIGAGTEAFSGSNAVFTTSAYSVTVG